MNFFKSVSSSSGVIDPVHALPGRDKPLKISGRHLINGSSMKPPFPTEMETIIFGMGCFWGAEKRFWEVKGLKTTVVGYSGGKTDNPTYEEVCSGQTGHAEVVRIFYNPRFTSFENLMKVFWESHNPTQLNRQGNDIGPHYRSVIFYSDENQKLDAESVLSNISSLFSKPIVTEISPLINFFPAEDYHHDYFTNNPRNPYCITVVSPKISKTRAKYSNLYD